MIKIRKYNECLLDGEDFPFKEITDRELSSWNSSHESILPSRCY